MHQEQQQLIKKWRDRIDVIGYPIHEFTLEKMVRQLQPNRLYEETMFLKGKKKNGKRSHSARGLGGSF